MKIIYEKGNWGVWLDARNWIIGVFFGPATYDFHIGPLTVRYWHTI